MKAGKTLTNRTTSSPNSLSMPRAANRVTQTPDAHGSLSLSPDLLATVSIPRGAHSKPVDQRAGSDRGEGQQRRLGLLDHTVSHHAHPYQNVRCRNHGIGEVDRTQALPSRPAIPESE